MTSVAEARASSNPDKDTRQRSTIAFPYSDLDSVLAMVVAIHSQVGHGSCDDHQLAAWTNQSSKSSGYRSQLSAARMFGLIESISGNHKLTPLGRRIVDPSQSRAAKCEAFLSVPLFSAVYEKYKSELLPPPAALEREMESLGVAAKTAERARRMLDRSAEQAGFYLQGRGKLVRPGVAPITPKDEKPHEESGGNGDGDGSGGSGGGKTYHPFIQGLLQTLPEPEEKWSLDQRVKWLQTAANIFDLIYEGDGGVEVRPAQATRSPRPE